jgi:RHS repeat-associated protein
MMFDMVKPTQRDGNMVTKTETIGNQQFITSYSYDEHDRMTSMTYSSGKVVGYVYDDKGELVSLNIDGVPFISDIKTNDNGLLSYTYADGTKHTRTYDENGRVKELSYPNYTEKVNYNKVSNITNIQSDAMSRAFGYDNLDRLTSYEHNATDFQNFAYDANGNRLSQSQEANNSKTFTYLANSNTLENIVELNSTDSSNINYEYDATGNIIKDDKHSYSYDGRNRLTAIDNNVTYQYNYDNKRVSKTVNGVKTYFIYDGYKLIGEYELNINDESRQEMVYLNSTPIATITPTGTYRIYADHLDTSRRVATNDEEAKVLWEWESKPFGESLANEDVDEDNKKFTLNLRFPGQYFDSETAHHYNINRDYNPVTGRYVQSDPIGFDGGLNTYAYANGNAIKNFDENGLDWARNIKDYRARRFVFDKIRPTLIALSSIKSWYKSTKAEQLLLGTALKESGHFRWRRQIGGGPGRSYYQIEVGRGSTFNDIYNNYLKYRKSLRNLVNNIGRGYQSSTELEKNDFYATAIARVHYSRVSAGIPTTYSGQSYYWKRYFNTYSGKGTSSSYRWYWRTYVIK